MARVQTFSNGIDTQTWGIDLTAKYQTTINESGRLQLTGAFNQTQSQVNSDVRTPQRLGEEFDASIFGRESRLKLTQERPDNRLNLDATYEQGAFSAPLGRGATEKPFPRMIRRRTTSRLAQSGSSTSR